MKRLFLIHGAELLVLLLLAAIPLLVTNTFVLGLLTLLAIYGILLIGLDVTVGYLGQTNLAQAAFLGLGAYTAGLTVAHFGFGMMSALCASLLTGLAFGTLLAFPALRLEGPQFALATLSFSALAATSLNEWESVTNGAQGLSLVRPPLFGIVLAAQGFYWLCLVLLALVWMAMHNLLTSQWGRTFEALRDSPIATDAMGVGTFRHKVAAFALGSALGGLAGGLYAFNFQYLQPHSFGWELMVILLMGMVLGGRKSLWGALVGAAFIVLLPNLLSNRFLFQVFSAIGLLIARHDAGALNALQLGRTQAMSLGIDARRVRTRLILATAILAGTTTAYCGPIGVLGTVAPYIARRLLRGAEHRRLLPLSMLIGAVLALSADLLSRLLASPGTLPLNAMLALLGAPVVLAIIRRLNSVVR